MEEQDTGFTWIDGKKIYKKTVNFGNLSNDTYKAVSHGIQNLQYVVYFTGSAQDNNPQGRRFRPLNIPNSSSKNYAIVEFDNQYVYIYCGGDKTGQSAYITMYYTKTI